MPLSVVMRCAKIRLLFDPTVAMLYHTLFSHIVLLLTTISYAAALTCLKCDSTIKPLLCTEVEQCGPHEVCLTEAYATPSGGIRYKVGCTDKLFCVSSPSIGKRGFDSHLAQMEEVKDREKRDTLFCSECCDDSICNAGGCGNKGYDPALGPVCYSCATQIGPAGCEHIQQCGRDKVCLISPITIAGQTNTYTTSCEHPQDCHSVRLPTGGGNYACSACCNQSLCNSFDSADDICNNNPNLTGSTATATGITSSTMPQTVTSTSTSTSISTSEQPSTLSSTLKMTIPSTTPQVDCQKCARFTPALVCSTHTTFLQNCIQFCGFQCPKSR